MSIVAKVLFSQTTGNPVGSTQTKVYTANNVTTIIDKFTATNYSGSPVMISVNLVNLNDIESSQNLVVKSKSIAAGATYIFPEIVGHALLTGGFISVLVGTANALSIRASGREIA